MLEKQNNEDKTDQTGLDSDAQDAAIDALADDIACGADGALENAAQFLAELPEGKRDEAAKQLELRVAELREEMGVSAQPTQEELDMLRQLREHEERVIAHLLSRESLRKIRAMFFSNPALLGTVLSMGDALKDKGLAGLGMESRAANLNAPDTPAVKEKDSTPSR